jgi:hypothetical protein
MFKCKSGGGCTYLIPADTQVICVCAALTIGVIDKDTLAKLEQIETLRVQREIARIPAALERDIAKLNMGEA